MVSTGPKSDSTELVKQRVAKQIPDPLATPTHLLQAEQNCDRELGAATSLPSKAKCLMQGMALEIECELQIVTCSSLGIGVAEQSCWFLLIILSVSSCDPPCFAPRRSCHFVKVHIIV